MENFNKEDAKVELTTDLSMTKLSDRIDELIEKEEMKELVILKEILFVYKKEKEDKIKKNKQIENERFKNNLYYHLEKLLLDAIYLRNDTLRKDKIRDIYRWYLDKQTKWDSLDKISYRTDKNPDEEYIQEEIVGDEILIKDDEYERQEFKEHRTEIHGFEPPKERIKAYKTKKISPTKKFKKDPKVMADLRFNLSRFHGKAGNSDNKVVYKNNFFRNYPHTGKPYFVPSGAPVVEQFDVYNNHYFVPIKNNREIKSAYSINRPKHDFAQLQIEKEIIKSKNKDLAEKRNQEEMKQFLENYGLSKTMFNEKKELKQNIKNIVTIYEKGFKKDKTPEEIKQLYDENKDLDGIDENDSTIKNKINYNSSQSNKKDKSKKYNSDFTGSSNNPQENLDEDDEGNNNTNNDNNNNSVINKLDEEKLKEIALIEEKANNLIANPDYGVFGKRNKDLILNKISEDQVEQNRIKYDTVFLSTVDDKILKARIKSAKICNVNLIDKKKIEYTKECNPLSAFDEMNYKIYIDNPSSHLPQLNKNSLSRPKTANEFAHRNFQTYQNNFLALRKQMTKYDELEGELQKIINPKIKEVKEVQEEKKDDSHLSNKKILHKSSKRMVSASLPKNMMSLNEALDALRERPILQKQPSGVYYPKLELVLLKKPPEIKGKKKKKKGKKKKW